MNNIIQKSKNSFYMKDKFRPAIHIYHEDIDDYASELLTGIIGRDIYAEGKRSEFYDWNIIICNDPITENELELLCRTIGVTDDERTMQLCDVEDEDSITELRQSICHKLFSIIIPFEVSISLADDEGIWLLGTMIDVAILENKKKGKK